MPRLRKPHIDVGPASGYARANEVIREFGARPNYQDGAGGLISIRQEDDGTLTVELYRLTKVRVLVETEVTS